MSDSSDFLTGAIVGGIVGLVAGVLMAPAPGAETRARIVETGEDWRDRAVSAAPEVRRAVESARRDLIRTLKERLPFSEQTMKALDDVEREAEQDAAEPLGS